MEFYFHKSYLYDLYGSFFLYGYTYRFHLINFFPPPIKYQLNPNPKDLFFKTPTPLSIFSFPQA